MMVTTPSRGLMTRRPSIQLGSIILGLAGGAAIFVVGTPYFEIFESTNDSPIFNGALTVALGKWRGRFDRSTTHTRASVLPYSWLPPSCGHW